MDTYTFKINRNMQACDVVVACINDLKNSMAYEKDKKELYCLSYKVSACERVLDYLRVCIDDDPRDICRVIWQDYNEWSFEAFESKQKDVSEVCDASMEAVEYILYELL